MQLPRTRAEATRLGSSQFFTGKPCRRGHIAPRLTARSGNCSVCKRESDQRANRKRRGADEPTRPCPATCECCERPPGRRGVLNEDHDHETGKFRGWICDACNLGIGALGDTLARIEKTRDYLVRNR